MKWRISYCPLLWEWIARSVAAGLYRVKRLHPERLPAQGGALLVANHLSYVDVVALQLACDRPLRFVAYRGAEPNAFFEWAFGVAGAIVLPRGQAGRALREAIAATKRGDVVCIFPEGGISRTGQLMGLQRGFELIAAKAGVPVVPVGVDGLWGSIFSFSGRRYLWKRPRLMPTPVVVAFGDPIPPKSATVDRVRKELLALTAEAFGRRPELERHLGWEVATALAGRPGMVSIVDRGDTRREISAGALFAAAAVLAQRLRAEVPQGRVGIVLPPGIGAAVANIAVLLAGKTPVNLNFTAGRAATLHCLEVAEIDTVISAAAVRSRFPEFPFPEHTLDIRGELEAAGGKKALLPWLAAAWLLPRGVAARRAGASKWGGDQEAAVMFTSGSSGLPKGVVLTHRNVLSNCAQFNSMIVLADNAVMLGCLPIFHSFGFSVTQWCCLLRGRRLVTIPSPLDARKIIEAVREEGVTVFVGAPTFLRPLLKKAEPADFRTLELVVAGAEKLPEDVRLGFRERFQIPIKEGYGLTEMSPVTNVNQPDPPVTTATAGYQPGGRIGSVGRLLPGVAARIVDPDTGEERKLTEPGMLWLKGPNRFREYLHEPERTAAAIRDGWFVTGDLAVFDEEGFLTIVGRRSRFSKLAGEMVPHASVEAALAAALGLDPADAPVFAVVGVPDEIKGESLVLVSAMDLTPEFVRQKLSAAGLPNLWIPKVVRRVEAIPLLGTGKLDLAGCVALAKAL
ncbi:MAG TPA: AMP-binding protein [Opitutaceae bacterium]